MDNYQIYLMILIIVMLIFTLAFLFITNKKISELNDQDIETKLTQLQNSELEQQRLMREELSNSTQSSFRFLSDMLLSNQKDNSENQSKKLDEINKQLAERQNYQNTQLFAQLNQLEQRFKSLEGNNEQKLDNIRTTMEKRLSYIQEDNNKKLDAMREVVDQKLQKTLEDKMNQSFRLVNERLEAVYKGLGEMQTLAAGVGDLKKVLSNVKARGIVGEIQLGAILEEILTSDQYATNIATIPGSKNVVEYAIKLPGNDDYPVYLPIDSKFPADTYMNLQNAYENGNPEAIQAAYNILATRIKKEAKDIHDKYIEPPYTTDFAIIFLPFEGLYAEIVNRGLVEILQREYHINIAGPSTMAALLNSLQMGFRTLAIEKRSSEVWQILGAVKAEFDKFSTILASTQLKLDQANKELDKLVGVRTRAIQRKLKNVDKINALDTEKLLDIDTTDDEETVD
ncbi:MAG: DNA recombination protein RmuC [Erysipelotrichaceae bacterium]|nr:DNA recombination protein RmuC [Erysipelotrichaceae bacterium]MDD3923760.1 DNA recombination protein RmuC [Erysipelotrichaceae bacterium]MDD4642318.1 DNA recombination protein RmuC [Erysipelotrichaceae bacterium]